MADANLQAVLQAHGITASPRQLAEYLAEAVAAMEEGALIPAVRELPEAELEVLLPLFQFQVEERNETRNVKGVVPGIEQVIPALSPELRPVSVRRWFTSPSTELTVEATPDKAVSPRDWLLAGRDPKPVTDYARDL